VSPNNLGQSSGGRFVVTIVEAHFEVAAEAQACLGKLYSQANNKFLKRAKSIDQSFLKRAYNLFVGLMS
jgi:hypothetical protein